MVALVQSPKPREMSADRATNTFNDNKQGGLKAKCLLIYQRYGKELLQDGFLQVTNPEKRKRTGNFLHLNFKYRYQKRVEIKL